MEFIKPGININFVGRRKLAFGFSGLLILISIISLIAHGGPNYGIDFAGGLLIQASFKETTTPDDIRAGLKELGLGDSTIQRFGEAEKNEYLIRSQQEEGVDLAKLSASVETGLEKVYGKGKVTIQRVEMVGPKVGADLRNKAMMAMFFSILFIAVYISGRFEMRWFAGAVMAGVLIAVSYGLESLGLGWSAMILGAVVVTLIACWYLKLKYALGAIVALIHDVIITVGVFSLAGKEFTLPIVAALLAIIGYSLNDTIIVFDRIRENFAKSRRLAFGEVINKSINETLSRTILTSATTLLVVLALLFLGGGVIHDFAYALTVGILIGTYSSIFVASPILLLFVEKGGKWVAAAVEETNDADATEAPVQPAAPAVDYVPTPPKKKNIKKKKKKK